MPLDASIITNMQQPDFSGAIAQGMNMRNLAQTHQMQAMQLQQAKQEFNDNQAMRHAMNENTSIDPDTGNVSFDRPGTLKSLANYGAAHLAPQMQQHFLAQDQSMQAAKLASLHSHNEFAGELLNGITSQPTLDKARQDYIKAGFDPDKDGVPTVYNDASKQILDSLQSRALTINQQIENKFKQTGQDIEKTKAANEGKKLDVEMFKTFGSPIKNGKNNGPSEIDPSSLVNSHVPSSQQAKVFDEIKAAQNTAKSAPEILAAFDKAANNLHAADFVPFVHNADQKALHALMGPTFQDVEGTVRQAAMDNMNENVTPQFGDNANTIKTKRAALVGYLTSKSAAPTAKGSGIDLSKFKSTKIDPSVLDKDKNNFDEDVLVYAKKHGITPEEAQSVKTQRLNGKR